MSYWTARGRERNKMLDNYDAAFMRDMKKEYSSLFEYYRDRIGAFYGRYADKDGHVARAAGKRALTGKQTAALKEFLDEQRKTLALSNDPKLKSRLSNALRRKNISRTEAELLKMEIATHRAGATQVELLTGTLGKQMDESYKFAAYSIENAIGTSLKYGALRKEAISQALNTPWSGQMFSSRIWEDKDKLVRNVREMMTRAQTQQLTNRQLTKQLGSRMGVQLSQAERLVRTEGTYVANQATEQLYKSADVEKYEYVAIEDSRTSEECEDLNGRTFKMKNGAPGVNMPPMHPNCRSSIAPVMDGETVQVQSGKREYKSFADWKGANT